MQDAKENSRWINLWHDTMGQQKMQERLAEMAVFQERSERHRKKVRCIIIRYIMGRLSSDSYMNMREIMIILAAEAQIT